MKYKLLAIDLDGTFLNEEHRPTKANIMAVKKAAERGIKVVVCSGRTMTLLRPILKYMPKNQPVIAANGSIILDHNSNKIYHELIEKHTIYNIFDMLSGDYPDVHYHFYDDDVLCSECFGDELLQFMKFNFSMPKEDRLEFRIIPDAKKYVFKNDCRVSKVEIASKNIHKIKEILKRFSKMPEIEAVPSGIDGIEVTKRGINKGASVEFLANYYGYSIDECIAIGNDGNDIEMIKRVGLGVAVKNAIDCLKEEANYITCNDNNNDAIAEVIEKFI